MSTKYDGMSKDQLIEMIEEANTALEVKEKKKQWAETDASIYVVATMKGTVAYHGGYSDEFTDYLKGAARAAKDAVLAYLKNNTSGAQDFAEFVEIIEADWEER